MPALCLTHVVSYYQVRLWRIWSRNAENYPVLFCSFLSRFLRFFNFGLALFKHCCKKVAKKLIELLGRFCRMLLCKMLQSSDKKIRTDICKKKEVVSWQNSDRILTKFLQVFWQHSHSFLTTFWQFMAKCWQICKLKAFFFCYIFFKTMSEYNYILSHFLYCLTQIYKALKYYRVFTADFRQLSGITEW
jgi:hypothetical protein